MAAASVVPGAAVLAVHCRRVGIEVGGRGVDAHEAAQVRDQDVTVVPAHLESAQLEFNCSPLSSVANPHFEAFSAKRVSAARPW